MADDDERFLILRFTDQEELKEFYQIFTDTDLGELHKIGNDPDGRNKKKSEYNDGNKPTLFAKWGLEQYDQKKSEKPSLI